MKIKKNIKWIIISFFLGLFLFLTKFDYLFFEVKVCNNVDETMSFSIKDSLYPIGYWTWLEWLYEIKNNILWPRNGYAIKTMNMWILKQWECSEYVSMNRLSSNLQIEGEIYKDVDWIQYPEKVCNLKQIDPNRHRLLPFWKHTYTITSYNFYDNTYKCSLWMMKKYQ